MSFETLRCEVADGIATITLARPDTLNAVDSRMIDELLAAIDLVDADDAARALIVTGEGRAFCAGADMARGEDAFVAPGGGALVKPERGGTIALRLFALTKPVIAAVNGAAAGLGATMTLPMDIRIASSAARFGFVFARRGLALETCASYFLPRLVPMPTALSWCYSGRMVSADEALAAGLVSAVTAPEALMDEARRLARELTENSAPVSIALTRQMLWRGLGLTHPIEAHRIESRGVHARARSADAREGVRAFLDKRPPAFPEAVSRDMPDFYPWWTDPDFA